MTNENHREARRARQVPGQNESGFVEMQSFGQWPQNGHGICKGNRSERLSNFKEVLDKN
jgi:hypothetical protein